MVVDGARRARTTVRFKIRIDDPDAQPWEKGRDGIARLLLTHEREVHGERGKRVVFLSAFEEALPKRALRSGRNAAVRDARNELLDAALGSVIAVPVTDEERPCSAITGWFPWGDDWAERAVGKRLGDGRLERSMNAGEATLIWTGA